MLESTEYLEWQTELDYANRAFAAMMGGLQYCDITREEAKRLVGRQRKSLTPEGAGAFLRGVSLVSVSARD